MYDRQAARPRTPTDAPKDQEASTLSNRKAWVWLLAKVYELDVLACPKCGSRMSVIALILDPAEDRQRRNDRAAGSAPLPDDGGGTFCSVGDDYAHPSAVARTIAAKPSSACGQSGCQCGAWISKSSTGAGNRSESKTTAAQKTIITHITLFQRNLLGRLMSRGITFPVIHWVSLSTTSQGASA